MEAYMFPCHRDRMDNKVVVVLAREVAKMELPPQGSFPGSVHSSASSSPAVPPQGDVKWLTESEFQDKRAKGLCYRCDAKWAVGHRCKKKELSVMFSGGTRGGLGDARAPLTSKKQCIFFFSAPAELFMSV